MNEIKIILSAHKKGQFNKKKLYFFFHFLRR